MDLEVREYDSMHVFWRPTHLGLQTDFALKTLRGRRSVLPNVRVHFALLTVEVSVRRTIGPSGTISQVLEHRRLTTER